jgi:hemolysin activation/secretion protein
MPVKTLTSSTTPGLSGTAVDVEAGSATKSFQFYGLTSGTFSLGTYRIMASNDGSHFTQVGDDVSFDGMVTVECLMQFVRIYTVSYVSGTLVCTMNYHEPARS